MGTKELIETAVKRFVDEVPALKQLKVFMRIDLKAKGDIQTWRLDMPAIEVSKEISEHPPIEVEVMRPVFNQLAVKGNLGGWRAAYERGEVKVAGQDAIVKLIANVIERQEARTRLKKIRH